MRHSRCGRLWLVFPVLLGGADVGYAQSYTDCFTPRPPAIGLSMGRSSPYFDLASETTGPENRGSILVRGGFQIAGRVDLPIGGPWRARIEGSGSNWRVVRQTYGSNFELVTTDTVGHVEARQVVGLVGLQAGREPLCAYVLAGGGIFSLDYRGARLRRPGVALTAGIELPIGAHGAVQADVQLHAINTAGRYPVSSTEILAASLSVGWVYRF